MGVELRHLHGGIFLMRWPGRWDNVPFQVVQLNGCRGMGPCLRREDGKDGMLRLPFGGGRLTGVWVPASAGTTGEAEAGGEVRRGTVHGGLGPCLRRDDERGGRGCVGSARNSLRGSGSLPPQGRREGWYAPVAVRRGKVNGGLDSRPPPTRGQALRGKDGMDGSGWGGSGGNSLRGYGSLPPQGRRERRRRIRFDLTFGAMAQRLPLWFGEVLVQPV